MVFFIISQNVSKINDGEKTQGNEIKITVFVIFPYYCRYEFGL